MSAWSLTYDRWDPAEEPLREALCTLGNGIFATRGAAPEASADAMHYPGTYMSGLYNRLDTAIGNRTVQNEDLVNLTNWLPLTFRVDEGPWFDLATVEILEYRQELDMRRGTLSRRVRFRDSAARTSTLAQRRLVHMEDPHLAAQEMNLVPSDWSGHVEVRSGLDGRVRNAGVARYRDLSDCHLEVIEQGALGEDGVYLQVETTQSRIRVAEAARTQILVGERAVAATREVIEEPGFVATQLGVDLAAGQELRVEKVVSLYTSRDHAISEAGLEARVAVERAPGFGDLLGRHVLAWNHLWRRFDIAIQGSDRAQTILRLHVFHLLQTVSENTLDIDAGVPARGLHGEAYRGHIFWDELFIYPLLNYRLPLLSRSLLLYRYRRLPEARWAARQEGREGASYPWQSGSDGREESQLLHLNPRSGHWIPDRSRLQRHINVAIAYNVWQYFQVSADGEFMRHHGAEMLLEIARFLAGLAEYDLTLGRYRIRGVVGPDEYHDAFPGDGGAPASAGVDDNAYTNLMTVWVLCRAQDLLDLLPEHHRQEVWEKVGLTREELDQWEHVSRRMVVPFHDGIISQFQGYADLAELDWEAYRTRYGDIRRLDRILESEGDSTNRYRVSKQADVLMLFYLLSARELQQLLDRLGYPFDPATDIPRTISYYLARTAHGSSLSRLVHAWILSRLNREGSWASLQQVLESELTDTREGSTAEGIHLGAMAGTVDLVQRCYTGLEVRGGVLRLNPTLPDGLDRLELQLHYRGHWLQLTVTPERFRLASRQGWADPIQVESQGETTELIAGGAFEAGLGGSPGGTAPILRAPAGRAAEQPALPRS